MKNALTITLVHTGSLLLLSGPILAYLDIGLWGWPMIWGFVVIVVAVVHHNYPAEGG